MLRFVYAITLILLDAASQQTAGQTCTPFWVTPSPFSGGSFAPEVTYNDGTSPAMYSSYSPAPGSVSGFAKWNGHSWHFLETLGLPTGFELVYPPMAVLDDGSGSGLYLKGRHLNGSQFTYYLWRWTNGAWVPGPQNLFNFTETFAANPVCSYDDGSGKAIYGFAYDSVNFNCGVSRWSGTNWVPLGGCLEGDGGTIRSLQPLDYGQGLRLVLGGVVSIGGNTGLRGVVSWSGSQWERIGDGIRCQVQDMAVFDRGFGPELYILGYISLSGRIVNLARWTGQVWEEVTGAPVGAYLKTFNDGTGNALYVSGSFASAGGVPARGIAKYDGTAWHALGAGFSSLNCGPMIEFDDGRGPSLFFWISGGVNSSIGGGRYGPGPAQWVGCPNCYPDCDNSGGPHRLSANDFVCFLNRYIARDPYANCDVDDAIEISDFACFLTKFASGCP